MKTIIDNFLLNNKLVYIIGGNGNIGLEITKTVVSLGAKCVVLDISNNKISKIKNDNLKFIKFDCTKLKNIDKKLNVYIKKYGIPNKVINCSYPRTANYQNTSINKIKLSDLNKNIEYHLNSYAWISKFFCEKMKKRRSGDILNFGSIYGVVGQDTNLYKNTESKDNYVYPIIKGGIVNMTKQLASTYGKFNVRVNCICPGAIDAHVPGLNKPISKKFKRKLIDKIPLKRLGKATEIASISAFLISDASSYVTGAIIMADGGWTAI